MVRASRRIELISDDFPGVRPADDGQGEGMVRWLAVVRLLAARKPARASRSFPSSPEMPRPCAALIGTELCETKPREIALQILVFRVIDLVHHQDDRRFRFAQNSRQLLIDRRESVLRVDHEQNHVAFAHGGVRRVANLRRQLRFARAADSSRVPNRKRPRPARAGRGQPIARDPGLIVHDRDIPAGESIEERRLADIRPADDGDFAHAFWRVFPLHGYGRVAALTQLRVRVAFGR